MKRILAIVGMVAVAAGAPAPAAATIDITVAELGADVVFSYSGALDLAGANVVSAGANTNAFVSPVSGSGVGAIGFGGGSTDRVFDVTSLPPFGTGSFLAGSALGPGFGVFTSDSLGLPLGYVSDTQIVGSLTLTGQTLASLGLLEGVYVTGSLPSGDFVHLTIPQVVPEPALALLALSGAAALGLRRRLR
ncbi:MAG: hypothetical protein HKP30_12855 [Myxococcales bacterium]|nr:hypothetical protein [Myxococcales bacterium]